MLGKIRIALVGPTDGKGRGEVEAVAVLLQSRGFQVVSVGKPEGLLGFMYTDPPELLIADLTSPSPPMSAALRTLKEDSFFSSIPVLALIEPRQSPGLDWKEYPVDDFVTLPADAGELLSRISLAADRIQRVFDNNPLTKLPGNTSIHFAVEDALRRGRAVCYVDINDFKPYNDTYGFSRGDEVIRITARIVTNAVRESCKDSFVGHLGGDDFVFVVPGRCAEEVCEKIISHFDMIAPSLFDEVHRKQGYYTAKDRRGRTQRIPLLGLAIAVVDTSKRSFEHAGRLAEAAAELKKLAKEGTKSRYVIDRRRK
ncbi:MAG TPA: diguanylate cyclase [Deltaproteobacteria bacterium]|nr:diguanylate cyclase [Deltaproteobacteria bacterium]